MTTNHSKVTEQSDTGDARQLCNIIEALLLAAGKPLSLDKLFQLLGEECAKADIRQALSLLQAEYQQRGIELVEVSSGYRVQSRARYSQWVSRLWEEKPQKYSRALLETLALIAYRQPITRGDIEEIRGVAVSSNIIKTLLERNWVRVVGHREVPGRPSIYATTREFLDHFNLNSLEQLPPLAEIRDLDLISREVATQLELETDPEVSASNAAIESQLVSVKGDENEKSEMSEESKESSASIDSHKTGNVQSIH